MDKKDETNKLDALKRRRELLVSLAARRRLFQSSSTPKQEDTVNSTKATANRDSSLNSYSSDVIEDSDIENEYRENHVVNENKIVDCSDNSNDICSTSSFSLPLTHPFFGNSYKVNENASMQSNKSKPNIHIISAVVIAPPVTTASIFAETVNDMPKPTSNFLSPKTLNLLNESEMKTYPDSEHLQIATKVEECMIKATSPDLKESVVNTEPEDPAQNSTKILNNINTDANINSCPELNLYSNEEPPSDVADDIASFNTSPSNQITTSIPERNVNLLDSDIDDQINSPSIRHDISKPNQQPIRAALSPQINDDHIEPLPGPSSENILLSTENDTPKGRKRHFRQIRNKAHVDYLSDEEQRDFSAGSSDLWSNRESDASSEDMKKTKRKKKTNKVKNTDEEIQDKEATILIKKKEKRCNIKKLRKNNKSDGKSYQTRTGVTIEEKKIRENPCIENKCLKRCFDITEERRNSLFNHFWGLDSQRRRDWILRCIKRVPIKRKRTSTPESRRTATYEYFINDGEDHRKVCQKFLIHTLDITQKYLTYTIQNSQEDMAQQDMRKPNVMQKYSEATKQYVTQFIEKLPVLPSHYNRPKSDRMYLPQEYKSTMHIYRKYLQECKTNGYLPVSETIFRNIFKEYNISIHIPKKDKCTICTEFENNKHNDNDSEKDSKTETAKEVAKNKKRKTHLEEKTATYQRFKSHQNSSNMSNDTLTTSFDLQKVLNTPYGQSMLLYYSRKYAVFNLTFYESGTQDSFCYTWGESDGKRGSNEIATCLLKYLQDVDSRGVKNLLLYCDSCGGQNKNKTVLATLNYFLKTSNNLQVIQINFLLPGHTYMPVDSVHAIIEREVKKIIVWSPSQWPTFFQSARKNPRPYQVDVLDHTDFLDFEELAEETFTPFVLKKIRLQQIRIATFKTKYPDQLRIKYSMSEEAEEIRVKLREGSIKTKKDKKKGKGPGKQKGNGKGKGKGKGKGMGKGKSATHNTDNTPNVDNPKEETRGLIKRAYNARLPISMAKYKDLLRLCENGTIPKRYHDEYRQIPNEETVCDYFPLSECEETSDD